MSISDDRRAEVERARSDPDPVIALIREAISDEDKARRLQSLICAPVRTFFRGLALVLSTATFAIIACVVAVRFASGSHHINYMWIASTGIVGTVGSLLTFVTMRIKTMWRRKIRGRRNDEANSGRLTGTR